MSDKKMLFKNKYLRRTYLTDSQEDEVFNLYLRERRIVSVVLLIVIVFGVQDFVEDLTRNPTWYAMFVDVIYVSLMIGLLIYIWRITPLAGKHAERLLGEQYLKQSQDTERWRNKAADLIEGLGRMIADQLEEWQLTTAEKEVALLLLKGYSLKHIATIRGISERTARQQAAEVYRKGGLAGRAELSAFFLEDLLSYPVRG